MKKNRILIVEDETIIAMDLKYILESNGYDVTAIADNAETAYQIYQVQKPDLLLLDILLKGEKTGIDLYKQIKHAANNVKIIFLTGNVHLLKNKIGKGYKDLLALSKPTDENELVPLIKKTLN